MIWKKFHCFCCGQRGHLARECMNGYWNYQSFSVSQQSREMPRSQWQHGGLKWDTRPHGCSMVNKIWNAMTLFSLLKSGPTKDPRPFCTVKFDNQDVVALVDTGSEISALDFGTFCRLNHRPPLTPAPFCLKSASSDVIPVRGIANLKVVVAGKLMVRPFCILGSPVRKCIVGADILTEEGISLKTKNHAKPD